MYLKSHILHIKIHTFKPIGHVIEGTSVNIQLLFSKCMCGCMWVNHTENRIYPGISTAPPISHYELPVTTSYPRTSFSAELQDKSNLSHMCSQ